MKGKLIVLDGADGSGKATQTKLLVKRLKKEGIAVKTIDFPRYDRFFGKMVKHYLAGEFGGLKTVDPYLASLLYAGDRMEAASEIKNWLNNGFIVIANRYTSSNAAHQGARVNRAKREKFLNWLYQLEYDIYQIPREDTVIYLDVPVDIGQKLVLKRGKGFDQHESNLPYLKKVAQMYRLLAKQNKHWHWVQCVKRSTLLSPTRIHEKVWKIVEKLVR